MKLFIKTEFRFSYSYNNKKSNILNSERNSNYESVDYNARVYKYSIRACTHDILQ